MKCPFCAEEIRDDAVLCRFCGARRTDVDWQQPANGPPSAAGRATPPHRDRDVRTIRNILIGLVLVGLVALAVVQYQRSQDKAEKDAEDYVDCIVEGGTEEECR